MNSAVKDLIDFICETMVAAAAAGRRPSAAPIIYT